MTGGLGSGQPRDLECGGGGLPVLKGDRKGISVLTMVKSLMKFLSTLKGFSDLFTKEGDFCHVSPTLSRAAGHPSG